MGLCGSEPIKASGWSCQGPSLDGTDKSHLPTLSSGWRGDFRGKRFAAEIVELAGAGHVVQAGGELGGRGSRVRAHPGNDDPKNRSLSQLALDADFPAEKLA